MTDPTWGALPPESPHDLSTHGEAMPSSFPLPAQRDEPGHERAEADAVNCVATEVAGMATVALEREPWVRVSLSYRLSFLLASMVGGLSSVCIKQLLLPIQVSQLAPHATATAFALVASLGACAGLIAAPLSGALSDRTTARWGRRRPWIVGGTVIAVVGLLTMAWASSIPLLLVGEVLAQIGVDTILATVTALLPDQIPAQQRSGPAAINGMAPIVGGVLGLVLVTRLTAPGSVWQGYVLLALVSAVCIGLFLLVLREQPISRQDVPPFAWRAFLTGFFSPLRSRDFACTLLSRALVFLSFTVLGSYLFFYLSQGLRLPVAEAAQTVTTFQVLSTTALTLVALLAGMLTQRFQRLKPCIITSALVMAASLLLLVADPTWFMLLVVAVLFGGGFGAVLGVDIALAIRVLPNETDRGKDLGLISAAIFLPLIASPLIGALILTTVQSFAVLFGVAAASSVLAAACMLPLRAVR